MRRSSTMIAVATALIVVGCDNAPVETDAGSIEDAGPSCTPETCDEDGDGSPAASDCDDANADVYPGATELCNSIDDDCDGATDEEPSDGLTFYADSDGDTFGDVGSPTIACAAPDGYVEDATDCDDALADVNPGASELCDGTLDENCDGAVDEVGAADGTTYYADVDRDGYGDPGVSVVACAEPGGWVVDGTDCDDATNAVYPGAAPSCRYVDADCDGTPDTSDAIQVPGDHATIQAALDAAPDAGHVCVAAGVFFENVVISREVTLESARGSEWTTIDGGAAGRVMHVDQLPSGAATIRGFTLRNGATHPTGTRASSGKGLMVRASPARFEDMRVTGFDFTSDAWCLGPIIQTLDSDVTFSGLEITDVVARCGAVRGLALHIDGGSADISRLWIADTTVEALTEWGQGFIFNAGRGATVTMRNVVIAGNTYGPRDDAAQVPGALLLIDASLDLVSATIVGNVGDGGNAPSGSVFSLQGTSSLVMRNVTIFDNTNPGTSGRDRGAWVAAEASIDAAYCNVVAVDEAYAGTPVPEGLATMFGNFGADPLHIDTSAPLARNWDLHLMDGSPNIDTGDPALLDADGTRSDVGAYSGPAGESWGR